jgi:hypothetical protein
LKYKQFISQKKEQKQALQKEQQQQKKPFAPTCHGIPAN